MAVVDVFIDGNGVREALRRCFPSSVEIYEEEEEEEVTRDAAMMGGMRETYWVGSSDHCISGPTAKDLELHTDGLATSRATSPIYKHNDTNNIADTNDNGKHSYTQRLFVCMHYFHGCNVC